MIFHENMRNYLIIDGKSTIDFGVYLSGYGTFKAPEKNIEEFTIPGRNGTFHYKAPNTYKNVKVTYDCFIFEDFDANVAAFRSYLLSRDGYVRIEDTHHPDEFRLGMFHNEFAPDVFDDLSAATFTIEFDCKPERYLKSGEIPIALSDNNIHLLNNPTMFNANPLFRCYGTNGSITAGSITAMITDGVSGYADIDCEIKDVIPTTLNAKLRLPQNEFPYLAPGANYVKKNGFSKVEIYPRWWRL